MSWLRRRKPDQSEQAFFRLIGYGNQNQSLGWPWTLTRLFDEHKRLYPHEVATLWGEATWTARDLWEVRS
jgi:hypothetical protein